MPSDTRRLRTNILVTGAYGQIGSELTLALRSRYDGDAVIATDRRPPNNEKITSTGPTEILDCLDRKALADCVQRNEVHTIYHLAALLSAVAEEQPQRAWDVNVNGLLNILEVARVHDCAVFTPSSIAAFGPCTPRENTPQDTILRPTSIYGISKVTGELLCDYYHKRSGLDTRGVRYPGIISHETLPGGGTTDYAVDIFYHAVKYKRYECFLRAGTFLDMMYMPDCIDAAIGIMEADPSRLRHRNAFNVTSTSFDPELLAAEIRKHIPEFKIVYDVDPIRQSIADSWPRSIDDTAAREEWGWNPKWSLADMTGDMLKALRGKLDRGLI